VRPKQQLKSASCRSGRCNHLVREYRTLREAASEHQAAINALASDTARRFWIEEAISFDTRVFVPKSLTTTETATGAVFVQHQQKNQIETVDCELDGVLVDFQQTRSFSINRSNAKPFTIAPFNIVGTRGGMGKIKISMKKPGAAPKAAWSFGVRVSASALETAKDVLVFVTPCGGVAGLLIWFLWKDVAIAGPIGAGIGSTIGLLIFLLQRLRLRDGPRAYREA
jgi:hypothetical protein